MCSRQVLPTRRPSLPGLEALRSPRSHEGAVKESDVAADDRYEHAADLTLVNELRARLQEVSTAEQKLAEGRTQLENETAKSAEAWKQMWARAEIEAREPAEMTGWREEHHNLISIIGEIANKERSLRSEEETIATHVEALRSTISELGLSPDSTSLQYLVAQAEEIVTDARDRAETRRTADSDLKRALPAARIERGQSRPNGPRSTSGRSPGHQRSLRSFLPL